MGLYYNKVTKEVMFRVSRMVVQEPLPPGHIVLVQTPLTRAARLVSKPRIANCSSHCWVAAEEIAWQSPGLNEDCKE